MRPTVDPYGERLDLWAAIERQVRSNSERPCVTSTASGETLTYGQFGEAVDRVARALLGLGAAAGSAVNLMLPNAVEYLTVSYALKKIGAVEVAINAEFRGPSLVHTLNLSGAEILVTSASLSEHLAAVADEVNVPRAVVIVEDAGQAVPIPALETLSYGDLLRGGDGGADPGTAIGELDPATVVFTSGTTGVSKGCVVPHRALVRNAQLMVRELELGREDCFYAPYPLFHMHGAYLDAAPTLMVGGHVVLAPGFSVGRFWEHVHRFGVTAFSMNGTVQGRLWKAEPSSLERGHRLRLSWGGPLPIDFEEFESRFGFTVLPAEGVYGMSETGMVCMSSRDRTRNGRVLPTHEVRIADDQDDPLAPGETGEILVRPREPGAMFSGYLGRDDATVESNRNFWFHTGDLGSVDQSGRLTFISRRGELIRRGDHSFSASKIEAIVDGHPGVLESAAIGVLGELGEEEVKLYVAVRERFPLSRDELLSFCRERMESFMVPQHLEILSALPKTPTGKVARAELSALDS